MTWTLLVKLRDRRSPATSLDKKMPFQVFCCDFYVGLRIPLLENTSKPLFLLQWELVLKHSYSQNMLRYFSNKKTEAIVGRCSCEKERFCKTHWNTYVPEFLLVRAQAELFNFIKKPLWHWPFPVSFAKFLRTPSFIEHLCWLLLKEETYSVLFPYLCVEALNHVILKCL